MGLSLVSREKAEAAVLSLLAPHTSTLYVTHYLRLVTYEGRAIMVLIFLRFWRGEVRSFGHCHGGLAMVEQACSLSPPGCLTTSPWWSSGMCLAWEPLIWASVSQPPVVSVLSGARRIQYFS